MYNYYYVCLYMLITWPFIVSVSLDMFVSIERFPHMTSFSDYEKRVKDERTRGYQERKDYVKPEPPTEADLTSMCTLSGSDAKALAKAAETFGTFAKYNGNQAYLGQLSRSFNSLHNYQDEQRMKAMDDEDTEPMKLPSAMADATGEGELIRVPTNRNLTIARKRGRD
jgi:hypothetical protein